MNYVATVLTIFLCALTGTMAQAQNPNTSVLGQATDSYQLWMMPELSFYDSMKREADRDAEHKCLSQAARDSDYVIDEEFIGKGKVTVTVSAMYRCL